MLPTTTSNERLILVTGGCGFIGRHLVEALLVAATTAARARPPKPRTIRIRVLDLDKTFEDERVEFCIGDIRHLETVRRACIGIDTVFHAAAATAPNASPHDCKAVNVMGTQNLIDACLQQGVEKLVYVSSASVVMSKANINNGDESSLLYPKHHLDAYAATKAQAEACILRANGRRTGTARGDPARRRRRRTQDTPPQEEEQRGTREDVDEEELELDEEEEELDDDDDDDDDDTVGEDELEQDSQPEEEEAPPDEDDDDDAIPHYRPLDSPLVVGTDEGRAGQTPSPLLQPDEAAMASFSATPPIATRRRRRLFTCALRPHIVFGPRDTHFLMELVSRASDGGLTHIVGDGNNVVDFTYVGNFVHALLLAADALGPTLGGQAYFITNGEPRSFWAFVGSVLNDSGFLGPTSSISFSMAYGFAYLMESLGKVLGSLLPPTITRHTVCYMACHCWFSHAKATRDFGYRPIVPLDDGLQATLQWMRSSGSLPLFMNAAFRRKRGQGAKSVARDVTRAPRKRAILSYHEFHGDKPPRPVPEEHRRHGAGTRGRHRATSARVTVPERRRVVSSRSLQARQRPGWRDSLARSPPAVAQTARDVKGLWSAGKSPASQTTRNAHGHSTSSIHSLDLRRAETPPASPKK